MSFLLFMKRSSYWPLESDPRGYAFYPRTARILGEVLPDFWTGSPSSIQEQTIGVNPIYVIPSLPPLSAYPLLFSSNGRPPIHFVSLTCINQSSIDEPTLGARSQMNRAMFYIDTRMHGHVKCFLLDSFPLLPSLTHFLS